MKKSGNTLQLHSQLEDFVNGITENHLRIVIGEHQNSGGHMNSFISNGYRSAVN